MRTYLWTIARMWSVAAVFTSVLSHGSLFGQDGSGDDRRAIEWRSVERALRLVHIDRRFRVALIDPDLAPDAAAIARLDAFIVRDADGALRPVIYINRRSTIVQRALAGQAHGVEELAAVIYHEARHLAGDSEAEARRAEREFFQSVSTSEVARNEPARVARP